MAWWWLLLGCAERTPDVVDLPTDEPPAWGLDSAPPLDIGSLIDSAAPPNEPAHTLTLWQSGWLGAEAGWLSAEERPDGWSPPGDTAMTDTDGLVDTAYGPVIGCAAAWSLTPLPLPSTCDGCDAAAVWVFARDVEDPWFELPRVDGPLDACVDPDRPQDGDRWVLAHDPATGVVRRQIAGVWLPWFVAEAEDGRVNLRWTGTFGVVPPEEEE